VGLKIKFGSGETSVYIIIGLYKFFLIRKCLLY